MALTAFGKAVRKARIDAGETLLSMAQQLGVTPAFLSGMETGRKKIHAEWARKIAAFFHERNVQVDDLPQLANVANEAIPVDGLPLQQQMLLAGFAKTAMTDEQLNAFAKFLAEIHQQETN